MTHSPNDDFRNTPGRVLRRVLWEVMTDVLIMDSLAREGHGGELDAAALYRRLREAVWRDVARAFAGLVAQDGPSHERPSRPKPGRGVRVSGLTGWRYRDAPVPGGSGDSGAS